MTTERDDLAVAMAALVRDEAMVVPFVAAYGDRLAKVVCKHLRELGRWDLTRDDDEVGGLVWDVALLLHDTGAGWRPTGALPWTWAHRAIRSHVASVIGHAQADVDPGRLAEALAGREATPIAVADVDELVDGHPDLALYRSALAELAVKDLHRLVHREYRIQLGLGDPSPSKTVAAMYGLSEANVRQIDVRVRQRLAALVAADPRFEALRVIPWLDVSPSRPPDPSDPSDPSDGDDPQERAA